MTIDSVSLDCGAIDSLGEEEKIGNLGKKEVSQSKDGREIPFLAFEKKYPAAWFRPEAFLAMASCSRIDFTIHVDTPLVTIDGGSVLWGL